MYGVICFRMEGIPDNLTVTYLYILSENLYFKDEFILFVQLTFTSMTLSCADALHSGRPFGSALEIR